jgi:hypothetical protein
LSYVTSSSLTTILLDYVTNSSLTTTLAGYASKTVTNTYTALQTFSSGLTVPSGQTLTCNGTIAGSTITATTQTATDNSTNVATTAFVKTATTPSSVTINATATVGGTGWTSWDNYVIITSPSVAIVTITMPTVLGTRITILNKTTVTHNIKTTATVYIAGVGYSAGASMSLASHRQMIFHYDGVVLLGIYS